MAKRYARKPQYEVLNVEEFLRTKAITFKAPDLPIWTVFIDKRVWTPEVEKRIILHHIDKLKQELKKRAFKELYAELTETQSNILWSLAVNGPCSSLYELTKRKIKLMTPQGPREIKVGKKTTIRRDLDYLEQHSLIKISRTTREKRGKLCSLTTLGLFKIFEMDMPEVWAKLDKIILNNKEKVPRIFGKWEKFIRDGTVDNFKIHIINYFSDPLQSNLTSYRFLKHLRSARFTERALAEDMARHTLLPQIFPYVYKIFLPELFELFRAFSMYVLPEKGEIKGWFKTLIRYPNLRGYLLDELERLEHESKNFSLLMKQWKKILRNTIKELKR